MSIFLLGMILGTLLGMFFTAFYFRGKYKELLDLMPGVIFENRILVQSVLATFPSKGKGIYITLKGIKYHVFKENGDIRYVEAT